MIQLPARWTLRPPGESDAQAVHTLSIACDIAAFGEPDTDLEDIVHAWSGIDLARDAWLVLRPDDSLAGYALVSGDGAFHCDIYVDPQQELDWLIAGLLDLCEARAVAKLAGSAAPGTIRTIVPHVDQAALRALQAAGFSVLKYFFRMEIEMAGPPPEPTWPAGWTIRNIAPGQEDWEVYQFIRVAFAGEGGPWAAFEDWRAYTMRPDHYDPSLWFLLENGDELIGAAACYDYTPFGWVRHLAVAESWRRQGIGARLLQHVFGVFHRRGLARVALGVHSQNPNALRLYESVGMKLVRQFDEYLKLLEAQPGARS